MKEGDKVKSPFGEIGTITRVSKHDSFDWWVEFPELPGGIPSMEMPYHEKELTLVEEINK